MNRSTLSTLGDSFRTAGKVLERTALQFRSYFVPTHIWTYWKIVRRQSAQKNGEKHKYVFFDFTRAEIDNVSGRYLFALVRDFEALGFVPCYRKRFRFLATMEHKRFKRFLLDRPFRLCSSLDELPAGSVSVEVTDRRVTLETPERRRIQVRYEAVWPKNDREMPMTFFVHPAIYDQWLAMPPPDLAAPRPWRLFFSGRILGKYGLNRLPDRFGKMSRPQILHTVLQSLPAERLRRIESAADLEPGAVRHPAFVWSDTTRHTIPRPNWLDTLTRADFFLACPGMDMPLCHNLIEALARSTVPVLEHPEFLDPPLEDRVNCLAFRGPEQLLKTVDRILQLAPEEVLRLRQGADAYYQKYLAPGRFAARLLERAQPRVDLLMNAYRTRRYP